MKTDNPSACARVNCKVCKSAIELCLSVIKRTCNRSANKSNHPTRHAYHPIRESI
jgi:hypothetical protein